MTRRVQFTFIARLVLMSAVIPSGLAWGQYVLPPGVIQKQAERDRKTDKAAGDTTAGPTTRPHVGKDQRQQIELLKSAALGADQSAAAEALHKLQSLGDAGKPALRDVVRQLLSSDRAAIEAAHALPPARELKEISEKIAAERKDARDNINKLAHDQTIKIAHTHYDSLKNVWEKLRGVFAQADASANALGRRGELLGIWHAVMPNDKQYSSDAESKLTARAEKAIGFTAAQLSALPQVGEGDAPTDAVLRDIWFYRACRRIEAYNATVQKCMSGGELLDAQFVNTYREYLGVLPFEYDPRLVDAARAHCSEMIELKYFAHESPTPANKTPWDRMRKAGYERGAGENIAYGNGTGDGTFWQWFDSPGHHQNMASLSHTALGVGNLNTHWTQDMGAGKRLMLVSPEERKAALGNVKLAAKSG